MGEKPWQVHGTWQESYGWNMAIKPWQVNHGRNMEHDRKAVSTTYSLGYATGVVQGHWFQQNKQDWALEPLSTTLSKLVQNGAGSAVQPLPANLLNCFHLGSHIIAVTDLLGDVCPVPPLPSPGGGKKSSGP